MNITRASVPFGSSRPIFQTIIFAVQRGKEKRKKKQRRRIERDVYRNDITSAFRTTLLHYYGDFISSSLVEFDGSLRTWLRNVFWSDSGEVPVSYIDLLGRGCICNKKRWRCFRKLIVPQTVVFSQRLTKFL